MGREVKKRTYASGRRSQQAEATRTAIGDAALALFTEGGYGATTIEDIAAAAGVAVPTVYKAFRTKRAVLERLIDSVMAGAPAARNLVEQEWFREQLDAPDARRQLELIARNARRMYDRAGPLLRVVRDAAATDPEIAALWTQIDDRRRHRSRVTARRLLAKAGVKRGVHRTEVADVLWSQTAPEMHHMLVTQAGWSPDRYEAWLGQALKALLLT